MVARAGGACARGRRRGARGSSGAVQRPARKDSCTAPAVVEPNVRDAGAGLGRGEPERKQASRGKGLVGTLQNEWQVGNFDKKNRLHGPWK